MRVGEAAGARGVPDAEAADAVDWLGDTDAEPFACICFMFLSMCFSRALRYFSDRLCFLENAEESAWGELFARTTTRPCWESE
jgi:hypothetical protein